MVGAKTLVVSWMGPSKRFIDLVVANLQHDKVSLVVDWQHLVQATPNQSGYFIGRIVVRGFYVQCTPNFSRAASATYLERIGRRNISTFKHGLHNDCKMFGFYDDCYDTKKDSNCIVQFVSLPGLHIHLGV